MKLTYNDKRRIYGQTDIYQAARGSVESASGGHRLNAFTAASVDNSIMANSFYTSEFLTALSDRVAALASLTGFLQSKLYDSQDQNLSSGERVFLFSNVPIASQEVSDDSFRVIAGIADNISAIEYLNAAAISSAYTILSYSMPLKEKTGVEVDAITAGSQIQTYTTGSVEFTEKINTFVSSTINGGFVQAVGHIADSSTGQMISIVFDSESVSAAEEIINIILELVTILRTVTEEAEYLKAATLEIIMLKADSQEGFPIAAESETINILLASSAETEVLRALVEEE